MTQKKCVLCHLPITGSDYYAGVPNAHKACHAKRVRDRRAAFPDIHRERDRMRNTRPNRVAARKAYSQSERGREVEAKIKREWQKRNAEKRAAHVILGNAVRDGRIIKPTSCSRCGAETESRRLHAHHDDYAKPLDVEWICAPCHRKEHA